LFNHPDQTRDLEISRAKATQVLEELVFNKANPDPLTETPDSRKTYTIGDDVDVITQYENGTGAEYLLYDGHGSTRQLVSGSSPTTIVDSFSYDGYGVMLGGNPTSASPAGTSMLYAGEQFDTSLQMYYNRARYYDQNIGRFNRMDPFAGNNQDPQSLHKYNYVHNNPINATDPSGEISFTLTGFSITSFAITLLIGLSAMAIISGYPLYVYRWSGAAYLTITKKTPGKSNEETYTVKIQKSSEFESEIRRVEQSGDKITFFEYVGHGLGDEDKAKDQRGWGLAIGKGGFVTRKRPDLDPTELIYFDDIRSSMVNAFASNALIELEACYSAYGTDSIAHKFKQTLPNASVWGYTGWAMPIPIITVQESFAFGGWTEVK